MNHGITRGYLPIISEKAQLKSCIKKIPQSGICRTPWHVTLLQMIYKNCMSFVQGQAEQQDNLGGHMVYTPLYCISCSIPERKTPPHNHC